MSFSEEKREIIKKEMLNYIRKDRADFVKAISEKFDISATSVKRYIKECLKNHIILCDPLRECKYKMYTIKKEFSILKRGRIEEHQIFKKEILPLLEGISKEAVQSWNYAFCEIMNNAIEHSKREEIRCIFERDYLYTRISIVDDGVGIFKNIGKYIQAATGESFTNDDIMLELYKGKLTTKPAEHSGEGIYFASKVTSSFAIWSDQTLFSIENIEENKPMQEILNAYLKRFHNVGTIVIMEIENDTSVSPRQVFEKYAPAGVGFVRTYLPLERISTFGELSARSQARRVIYRLDRFRQIELDFKNVDFMGQAFADELFRIFQSKYPYIQLYVLNANETVSGMIQYIENEVKGKVNSYEA